MLFRSENIKIKVEAVGDEPIKDKLRILMGTDTQPDIFFTWSGEFATKFITSGNSLDLTDALNSNPEWKDSIMEAGLEPFTYEGKNYGIPLRINGKFFVYNTEIFEKYNLEKPETWEEFLVVLETLKTNDVTPIGFGNIFPLAGSHYLTGLNQKFVAQDVRLTPHCRLPTIPITPHGAPVRPPTILSRRRTAMRHWVTTGFTTLTRAKYIAPNKGSTITTIPTAINTATPI